MNVYYWHLCLHSHMHVRTNISYWHLRFHIHMNILKIVGYWHLTYWFCMTTCSILLQYIYIITILSNSTQYLNWIWFDPVFNRRSSFADFKRLVSTQYLMLLPFNPSSSPLLLQLYYRLWAQVILMFLAKYTNKKLHWSVRNDQYQSLKYKLPWFMEVLILSLDFSLVAVILIMSMISKKIYIN